MEVVKRYLPDVGRQLEALLLLLRTAEPQLAHAESHPLQPTPEEAQLRNGNGEEGGRLGGQLDEGCSKPGSVGLAKEIQR